MRELLLLIAAGMVVGCGCGENGTVGDVDSGDPLLDDPIDLDHPTDPPADPSVNDTDVPDDVGIDEVTDDCPHCCGNAVIDPEEECDDGNDVQWDGCDNCSIVEFLVNTDTVSWQRYSEVAAGSSGQFVVVWEGSDASPTGIDGQAFDASGSPAGPEFQINTTTDGIQRLPSVAMAPDGQFAVTWYGTDDGHETGVFRQLYGATHLPVGSELQVNTYIEYRQEAASVAMASDGRFVVVWESEYQEGAGDDGRGIYGQLYNNMGSAVGSEFHVNTYTTSPQTQASVAMASDGSFVVTWSSDGQDGDMYGVHGQRFDSGGAPDGSEFQVNTYIVGDQVISSVAMAPDGRFVIVWTSSEQDGDDFGIFAQLYDATGTATGSEFQVNTHTALDQMWPSVSMASDGRFVVAWQSFFQDGSGDGIYAQRFDATGTPLGPEFQVNTFTPQGQEHPSVAMVPDGRFIVTWSSDDQDAPGWGIFAQRFDASGNPLGALPW